MRRSAVLLVGLVLVAGAPRVRADATGPRLLARFECARCHEGTGQPAPPTEKHCVRCHQQILGGTFPLTGGLQPETLRAWQGRLVSLPVVPSLTAAGLRLRRDFIVSFLLKPHDLRPGLLALMPRLSITPAEARSIAATLVPSEVMTPPPRGDLAEGRRLLETLGCGFCHRFTGVPTLPASPLPVPVPPAQLTEALALAPDLRFTRERFQPGALARWLQAPAAVKPDTRMPQIPLSAAQAEALATYLLEASLSPLPPVLPPPRLPVLIRRVSFDEVSEKVFRRTCWHCHSTPEYAMGDGGPGNTGGFGFKGRGLNVATYTDLASGSLDDRGQRRSVFRPVSRSASSLGTDQTPLLLAVLLARQKELAGQPVPGLRGMPLGLPALTPEQIQLVETWIAQGRPQ